MLIRYMAFVFLYTIVFDGVRIERPIFRSSEVVCGQSYSNTLHWLEEEAEKARNFQNIFELLTEKFEKKRLFDKIPFIRYQENPRLAEFFPISYSFDVLAASVALLQDVAGT